MATLFKRGDTWWVRFQANGVQVRRSTRTKRKVEALAIMRRMIEEHERERREPPSDRYRLSQAFDRFFQETSVKKGTRRTYASNRRNWTRLYPEIHIDEIDRRVLTDFISARKREKVTDTTIRRDLAFLGSVLSTAISWEWLDTNPVTSLSKRTLRESRPRTRFLTRAEFHRLYAAASIDLKPVLVLAVETGMRKEEMLGLPVCNIDLRRREVHLEDTKTNTPRRVPLSDQAVETIATILSNPSRPPSSYLFCKPDGSRILCNKKGFRAACRRAGIENFRFHDLRHTFASWWVQSGGDLYKLSRILGHRTLQMSARYGHLRTDDLHQEMARLAQKRAQDRQIAAVA